MTTRARLLSCSISVALLLAGLSAARAQQPAHTQPHESGLSTDRLLRLSDALGDYVQRGELPGAVALVARRGEVAYLEAFGKRDLEAGDPLRTDSIFRIASQTKALVSVAVMALQEEGLLLIGDPVGDYLPEFSHTTVAVPNESGGYDVADADRPITIRDLLTHTAGVSYGDGLARDRWAEAGIQGWYFADRDEPIRATIERLAALPFDAQPDEQWIYGYSTDIPGALVEQVGGVPLDELLRTRIFEPLGMNDTHFYLPPDKVDRLVTVYSATADGSLERAPAPGGMVGQGAYVDGPRKSFSGGAGLLSTATDYAKFLQMLLNGGAFGGQQVLTPKSVDLMTVNHLTDQPFASGVGFGLGFSVVESLGSRGVPGSVGEFGWGGAYHSTYWVDPEEQLVVVYLTQLIPAMGLDDHGKLRALVYQSIIN